MLSVHRKRSLGKLNVAAIWAMVNKNGIRTTRLFKKKIKKRLSDYQITLTDDLSVHMMK